MLIGYHASHEQFAPAQLLAWAKTAESAGFQAVMSADHFQPWSRRQGQSGHAWPWLGAAMGGTTLPFGTLCIPGGWRTHPAVAAQAVATLAQMFPNRLRWIAVGSGEALNERIVGAGWPDKATRNARLEAGTDIMRALWRGETVSRARPIPVEEAELFTRAEQTPLIFGAALTPETAEWMGGWTDGLITVAADMEKLKGIVAAFRRGGGQGKPIALQMHLSWAETEVEAREAAFDQWRANTLPPALTETLSSPDAYDAAAADVRPEDMDQHVAISSDPDRHTEWIKQRLDLGISEIYLHNVGRNQDAFIEVFGSRVLPRLAGACSE